MNLANLATLEMLNRSTDSSQRQAEISVDALLLIATITFMTRDRERMGSVIEILLLQALSHEAQDDMTQALSALSHALSLAEPEDYVRQLLAAFPATDAEPTLSPRPPKVESGLVEPLSEREIEVLQFIAEGLTNQEVADRLYLSLHTVKVHARNIYGKLGVKNRTQAVAKGRALGILKLTCQN